ncbi:hypothetical protein [Halanaerobium congolense]|jgi:hypothetical protein|uniref:Uncharacterized protein n=1 Tax=Halanaerobium congolense TaxID=54121 RepID=A0A4R7EBH4_9FIRM|nr:hypothetical protein [Halanaerobium congolense]TDS32296.1 hypothetical protein BY453_10889 [Halanaerobium congolense]
MINQVGLKVELMARGFVIVLKKMFLLNIEKNLKAYLSFKKYEHMN